MKSLFIIVTLCFGFFFTAFSQTCPTPPTCTHTNQTDFIFNNNGTNNNVLCITNNMNLGNIGGNIQAGQTATLYIAPGVSVNIGNMNTGVAAGGTFNIINEGIWNQSSNLNIQSHITFNNCATGTFNISGGITINPNATLNNLGAVNIAGGLNNNTNGSIYNSGLLTVSGHFDSDGSICGPNTGCGRFVVTGNSTHNSNGSFGADSGGVDCGNLDLCSAGNIGFGVGSQNGTIGSGVSTCHPDAATGCGTILPIELVDFQVKQWGDDILITWKTTSEIDNDYFLVERSSNGKEFKTIGKVVGLGSINTVKKYEFLDTEPQEGINYYRLNQVDYDGTSTLSKVITQKLVSNLNLKVKIYPNPSYGEYIHIKIENFKGVEEVQAKIYTTQGQEMFNEEILFKGDEIKITEQLANGVYFIELVTKEFSFKDVLMIN